MPPDIPKATGQALTSIGAMLGFERRRFLFFFREPDFLFRRRVVKSLKGVWA
jgi:hypothetical protein